MEVSIKNALEWMRGERGVSIILPFSALHLWRGAENYDYSGATLTDFDRACNVNKSFEAIPVAHNKAYVLGNEYADTAIIYSNDDECLIIRVFYGDGDESLLEEVDESLNKKPQMIEKLILNESKYRLLMAQDVGDDPVYKYLDFSITSGNKNLLINETTSKTSSFIVYKFFS